MIRKDNPSHVRARAMTNGRRARATALALTVLPQQAFAPLNASVLEPVLMVRPSDISASLTNYTEMLTIGITI